MATLSLYEVVRDQVENEIRREQGNYYSYADIDNKINNLTNLELLERISYALEVVR